MQKVTRFNDKERSYYFVELHKRMIQRGTFLSHYR